MRRNSDAGAAAVELALVLPILLTIVLGVIDFGFAFNAKIAITQAAREGVRHVAVTPTATEGQVQTRVNAALTNNGQVLPATATILNYCPADAPVGAAGTVQVTASSPTILPIPNVTLTARGVMRCEN